MPVFAARHALLKACHHVAELSCGSVVLVSHSFCALMVVGIRPWSTKSGKAAEKPGSACESKRGD